MSELREGEGMKVIQKRVNELIPYANNTRTHSDEQIQQIASSIKEFGFTNPILIDEKGGIIAGHGRLMGARLLQMDEVPTITLNGLTDAQIKAYIIADNKLALNAGWDEELLKLEIEALQEMDFDIDLLGFSDEELNDLSINLEDDLRQAIDESKADEVPAIEENPIIKLGDLIELGYNYQHRLLCGDSTSEDDVSKLMNGIKADMVFTDPPYNIAIQGKAGSIKNDDMGDKQFYNFLLKVYKNYFKLMKDGACIYVAHAETERINFTQAYKDSGLKLSQVLIWNKHSATLSRQDYNWKHEPILYGWKEGAGHYFCEDFTETTVYKQKDKYDLKKMKKDELISLVKELIKEDGNTIIDYDRPTVSDLHPTMKPVELVQHFIENSSKEGWLIVDLFGGAGSTLIASETSKRINYTMELDEKYAQVIIQRYVDYTSNPMIKINGAEIDWYEYKEEHS